MKLAYFVLLCMMFIFVTPVYADVWHSTEISVVSDEDGSYITDLLNANDTDYSTDAYHECGGTPCNAIKVLENYTWNSDWERADSNNFTVQISVNSTSGNTLIYAWNYTDSSYDYIGGFGNGGVAVNYSVYNIAPEFFLNPNDFKLRTSVASGTNSNTSYFETTLFWEGNPYINNCSGEGTNYLNFYGVDENTQDAVVYDFEIYMELSDGTNASFDMSGQNNYSICIDPIGSYDANAEIRYSATGYSERYYYLQNASLTANQNITLYLLNTSDSTLITMAVLDETNMPESDVVVIAQKRNIGLGSYLQVVEAMSDFEGFAYAYMELGENYKFFLTQDGVVLREYEPMTLQSDALTFYVSSVTIPEYFSYYDQVATSCSFDNATLNLTCNYVDTTGLSMNMIFNVSKIGQAGMVSVCNESSSSSSGTFICQLTDNATFKYDMYGCYPNDCGYTWQSGWIGLGEVGVNYGATGLVLALLIVCFCSLTAYYDVRLALVSNAFGFIFCGFINLIQFGAEGLTLMFGVAIISGIVAIKVKT